MPSRRALLKSAGTAAAGSLAVVGTAAAAHGGTEAYEAPDGVTIDFPADAMDRYRPALQLPSDPEERSRFISLYGWRVQYDGDDGDDGWYVFWASYTNQVGRWDFTSHDGDHEPIYVRVTNGEPVAVHYSVYHWFRGTVTTPSLPIAEDTHVQAHVVDPWHQFQVRDVESWTLPEVRDLQGEFDHWLDNGLREDLRPGSVHDPATMRSAPDWWRDDLAGTITTSILSAARPVGLGRPGGLL